jgi:hypothetical protein
MAMRRLYFMLPDTESCKKVVTELKNARIPERHLHVIASLVTPLDDLPEATLLQKSELAHGVEKGIALGGAAGLLGGLLVVAFPPAGLVVGGAALMTAVTAGSAGFGALAMGLISKDIHSKKLAAFESGIEQGHVLLIVDVPKDDVELWKGRIIEHHPEAEIDVTATPEI